jgi:hypothetical protein
VESIPHPGSVTKIPTLDFTRLVDHISNSQFYHYTGSLTTPPCSEGVTFLIAAHPLTLHVDMYNRLKAVVKANSRFAQNTLGQENLLRVSARNLGPGGEGVAPPVEEVAPVEAPPAEEAPAAEAPPAEEPPTPAAAEEGTPAATAPPEGTVIDGVEVATGG